MEHDETSNIGAPDGEVISVKSQPSRWARRVRLLLAEMLVVFVGVYGAFVLEDYREAQRDKQKFNRIQSSLIGDLVIFDSMFEEAVAHHQTTFMEGFIEAYERGEMPRPLPIPLPAAPVNTGSWDAMLSTGGFDVLDEELIRQVELLFIKVNYLSVVSERYNDYLMTLLVPDMDQETSAFYDSNQHLRGKYRWYIYFHRAIHQMLVELQADVSDLQHVFKTKQAEP